MLLLQRRAVPVRVGRALQPSLLALHRNRSSSSAGKVTPSQQRAGAAVLIDGDNVPPRLAKAILDEITQHVPQHALVDRRVYGDFSLGKLEGWKTAALEHGIEMKMQGSPSKTKNATDMALCIDAMDILHHSSAPIDTYVIVTNDGDFAPLAQRLRRSGQHVVAVGTGASLMASCDSHIAIDFARSPTPNMHTNEDVELLANVLYDLSMDKGGVTVSALASMADRKAPGWGRARVGDFVNFRHMLETPPYKNAFTIREARRGASPHIDVLIELKGYMRNSLAVSRAESNDKEDKAASTLSTAPQDQASSSWFGAWLFGKSSTPAGASAVTDRRNGGSSSSGSGNGASKSNEDRPLFKGLPEKRPATEHELSLVLTTLDQLVAEHGEGPISWGGNEAPPGEGWMHLSVLAANVDRHCRVVGIPTGWRTKILGKTMKESLTFEPFASQIEQQGVKKSESHTDIWVRRKP